MRVTTQWVSSPATPVATASRSSTPPAAGNPQVIPDCGVSRATRLATPSRSPTPPAAAVTPTSRPQLRHDLSSAASIPSGIAPKRASIDRLHCLGCLQRELARSLSSPVPKAQVSLATTDPFYDRGVSHFRYFVSERRDSSTPNRRNVNRDFENKTFYRLTWAMGLSAAMQVDFC